LGGGLVDQSELWAALQDRVVFVLVEPQSPGNVGAAARAMKNMGLSRLVIVAPPSYDPEQARWMAPGAGDILANARIVPDLDCALEGVHTAVAATARHRSLGHKIDTPAELADRFFESDTRSVVAVLFGREDHGLDSVSVGRCERLLRIPTPEHASLNLSQAVLLGAHAFFDAARRRGLTAEGRTLAGRGDRKTTTTVQLPAERDQLADISLMDPAVEDIVSLLERVGYTRGVKPEKVRATARQSLYASKLTVRTAAALRGMLRRIGWALDNPGVEWRKTKGS
jgi:TrmH family RNA methyltransferase